MNYKKNRRKDRVRHADDWLLTYADMITLLLCFFALFLFSSLITKKDSLRIADAAPPPSIEKTLSEKFQMPVPVVQDVPDDPTPPAETLDAMKTKGQARVEEKGDRITQIEMNSSAFFDRGSAQISDAGRKILSDVTLNLLSDKYKEYQITVEGHTDDTPINTPQFPSNWELSTARASVVVRFLIEQGVLPQRLSAAGYADSFPKVPNRDDTGMALPENQAMNRRVVIRLEKIEKAL